MAMLNILSRHTMKEYLEYFRNEMQWRMIVVKFGDIEIKIGFEQNGGVACLRQFYDTRFDFDEFENGILYLHY